MRRLSVACLAALLASCSPVSETPPTHTRIIELDGFVIDKIYRSMFGPMKTKRNVLLAEGANSANIWITGFRSEVLDEERNPTKQEFMCHTSLVDGMQPLFSIAQGQKEIKFPEGYALRAQNRKFTVMSMVLNNNYEEIDLTVNMRTTISYYDDGQASELGLKPLRLTAAQIVVPTEAAPGVDPATICSPAHPNVKNKTAHWMVPPGRHVYTTDPRKENQLDISKDTRIHEIWMHVHPYAESVELRDVTENRTVWKGFAQNHRELASILSTDTYSSPVGLPVFKDHEYELVAAYDNPLDRDTDAMASLWIYVAD